MTKNEIENITNACKRFSNCFASIEQAVTAFKNLGELMKKIETEEQCERCLKKFFYLELYVIGEPRDYIESCEGCMTELEKWNWIEGYADTHEKPSE